MASGPLGRTYLARWLLLVFWALVLGGLYVIGSTNFLLFHGLAEIFSVVIASALFFVAWNSRGRVEQNALVVVGVAYGFVAFLDTLHTLAYPGMGVFPGKDANLATQLWLAARYVEAGALVTAGAFLGNEDLNSRISFSHRGRDTALLIAGYGAVTAILVGSIFLGAFPDAFVAGEGLTPFKVVSEYLIVGLLAVAVLQLYRRRDLFDASVHRALSLGILLTIASELFFTRYVDVYSVTNVIGHLLKIASFYLVYLAVVKIGISNPQKVLFRQLQEERNRLADREYRLHQQNRRLNQFADTLSHDLRNPLSVAMGRLELARAESDNEHLEAVDRSLDRMNRLIEDVLTLAREGKVVDVESVDAVGLRDVALRHWKSVETGAATLHVDTDAVIQADEQRLAQLFENLFRNAIDHGGTDVAITVGATPDGFYVADDGDGIPAAERDRVFDAGYSTARDGTGFGLNIVREIAEAHGWEVQVGEGARGGARIEIRGVERIE